MSSTSRVPLARRLGGLGGPALILVLALSGAAAGCGSAHDEPATSAHVDAPGAMPTHDTGGGSGAGPAGPADPMVPSASDVSHAWEGRPAFVRDAPDRTQAAYAYALARPDVVAWLPCYCGCGEFGHGSNLDCFMKPRDDADDPLAFEEHGSYCDVCVETALMADRMLRDGRTLLEVRVAVDATFGGLAPGTPTDLPPS